jgi:hypothetical protein
MLDFRFAAGALMLLGSVALAPLPLHAEETVSATAAEGSPTMQVIQRSGDGQKQHLSTDALEKCRGRWVLADLDRDGVVAGSEVSQYNSHVRTDAQPMLPEGARLNKADFLNTCSATDVHE